MSPRRGRRGLSTLLTATNRPAVIAGRSRARRAFRRLRYTLPQPWSALLEQARQIFALRRGAIRREFAEEILIERLATSDSPVEDVGPGLSERVVEVPWVLRRIPTGRPRVLDVGTAFAPLAYKRLLLRLHGPRFELVDAALFDPRDLEAFTDAGIRTEVADVRRLPFEAHSFDAIVCISTLEHIGMDTTLYFDGADARSDGDVAALRELSRVAKRGAPVLVTVPAGEPRDFGWYRQYDVARLAAVAEKAGLKITESETFVPDLHGWRRATPDETRARSYRPGDRMAAAVLCARLRRD